MPWGYSTLNDGTEIPSIAFGTWKAGRGQKGIGQVAQAVSVGFHHIDTAQNYKNEIEAGEALKECGLPREALYITTKFSGLKDVETSIQDSLDNLGVSYVDLYLIHGPEIAKGDIPGLWKKFEEIYARGFARSIGVSNFEVDDLILLKDAKIKPVVNQILLHPYVLAEQLPILEYCKEQEIAIEAYSPLIPVTTKPGGALDRPLAKITARTGATFDQILLAWNKSKGTVVVTASSKKDRLGGYMRAGDLELTVEDIRDIDAASGLRAVRN